MYDEGYDMHIAFYGDKVDIESLNDEIGITLPEDCGIDELCDLLRAAIHVLVSREAH